MRFFYGSIIGTLSVLFKRFGEGLVRDLGSSLLAKVSSTICDENWKWPRQRNRATRVPQPKVPWGPIVWFKGEWVGVGC